MRVKRFQRSNVERQSGERCRLKVAGGPDYGQTFVLLANSAKIGRAEDNDIVLSDLKVSRNHALVFQKGNDWMVEDLGSSNGIFYQGTSTRKTRVFSGELFSVGETTFEFLSGTESTSFLSATPKDLELQQRAEQAVQEMQRRRIEQLTSFGGDSSARPNLSTGSGRQRLILLVVVLLAVLIFVDEPTKEKESSKPIAKVETIPVARDLASFLPSDVDPSVRKTADMFFRSGFREFREKNYLRAKVQFETVLQVHPTHKLARIYLENCLRAIDEEVDFHLDQGRKTFQSGRLSAAKGHFESILRLLHRDPRNSNYIEAKEQLAIVKEKMKGST